MDRGVRDVVNWGKDLRDFSFLDMIDFFEGSDGRPGVIGFSGSIDGIGGMKDRGIGNGIFVGTTRGRAVVVFIVVRHDGEVEVSEEGRVLIKVCEV